MRRPILALLLLAACEGPTADLPAEGSAMPGSEPCRETAGANVYWPVAGLAYGTLPPSLVPEYPFVAIRDGLGAETVLCVVPGQRLDFALSTKAGAELTLYGCERADCRDRVALATTCVAPWPEAIEADFGLTEDDLSFDVERQVIVGRPGVVPAGLLVVLAAPEHVRSGLTDPEGGFTLHAGPVGPFEVTLFDRDARTSSVRFDP